MRIGHWEPEKYENSYLLAVQALVDEKVQHRPAGPKTLPAKKQAVGDILAILQASLSKTSERKRLPARSRSTLAVVKTKRRGVTASS